jgi:hypothetical protein
VPAGQTLTIEPRVEVMFQSWHKLTVHGTLQAVGTGYEPILFTATDRWPGIRFVDLAKVAFTSCRRREGHRGYFTTRRSTWVQQKGGIVKDRIDAPATANRIQVTV